MYTEPLSSRLDRTPLYDSANLDENIPQLLRQIEIAVRLEGDNYESGVDHMHFSADDAREELERLRKDEHPKESLTAAGGLCALPAQVPDLPEGLRITTEMKQLLSALLTSAHSRIGFCGMGGIGKVCKMWCMITATSQHYSLRKFNPVWVRAESVSQPNKQYSMQTTISAFLVREAGTRTRYDQIVWVSQQYVEAPASALSRSGTLIALPPTGGARTGAEHCCAPDSDARAAYRL